MRSKSERQVLRAVKETLRVIRKDTNIDSLSFAVSFDTSGDIVVTLSSKKFVDTTQHYKLLKWARYHSNEDISFVVGEVNRGGKLIEA